MGKKDLDAIRNGQYMYPPGGGVSVKPIHTVSGPINIAGERCSALQIITLI